GRLTPTGCPARRDVCTSSPSSSGDHPRRRHDTRTARPAARIGKHPRAPAACCTFLAAGRARAPLLPSGLRSRTSPAGVHVLPDALVVDPLERVESVLAERREVRGGRV